MIVVRVFVLLWSTRSRWSTITNTLVPCPPPVRVPDFQVCLFGMGGRLGALGATAALTTGLLQYLPEITLVRGRQVTVATLGDSAYADGEPVQADRKSTRLNSSH